MKSGQKIRKNTQKLSKSDILCWHDIEGGVLIVQGPYLNIEHSHKNG